MPQPLPATGLLPVPSRRLGARNCRAVVLAVGCAYLLAAVAAHAADGVTPITSGLENPESVVWLPDGRLLISTIGQFNRDGDGAVMVWTPDGAQPLAEGLDDPKGLAVVDNALFVADKSRVWKIALTGRQAGSKDVFAAAAAFPSRPLFLNDLAADRAGNLYVSDSGNRQGQHGAIYRIAPDGRVTLVADSQKTPALKAPNGLWVDDENHLLVLDIFSGELSRLSLLDGALTKIADGFPGGDGVVRDIDGNIYLSQWTTGAVWVLPGGRAPAVKLASHFTSAADLGLNYKHGQLLVPDMKAGTLTALSWFSHVPRQVDLSPLDLTVEPAFPQLQFERPILLTHAGDGSNRVFVASQLGRVFAFPDDQQVARAELFFDLHEQVTYKDNENEEGFLGMAFHPRFKENGQFFVCYTTTDTPHVSVVSRFSVSADNPDHAARNTEQELLRISQPFWNHNGGTLAFGPDGYLYIALGDGGSANDPHGNGQNLQTWLGAILRIDVDRQDQGKHYAVPTDNPFVDRADARPEIWAYGLRNVWRMSFDRQTGACWAADVGQDIWEEINIIRRGGNYGWNLREAMHRFRADGAPPRSDLIDPVWEYHHDVGKSVTGGHVYRGRRLPQLVGHYLYADYVTGRIWALKYDEQSSRVLANRPIAGNIQPVMSFGEDEQGEVYFMTTSGSLFRFAPAK